ACFPAYIPSLRGRPWGNATLQGFKPSGRLDVFNDHRPALPHDGSVEFQKIAHGFQRMRAVVNRKVKAIGHQFVSLRRTPDLVRIRKQEGRTLVVNELQGSLLDVIHDVHE
ncbi:MAG: hypothetical protein ACK55I_46615, partial [bacterium]